MNRHYVYDEETPMTTQRDSNWLAAAGLLLLLVIGALAMLFVTYKAVAQSQPRTATITFTRPSAYTDGSSIPAATVVTYGVYQGAKGSTTKTKVGTITSTATTISTGLQPGETCWQVSAIANGVEGALSNEACKTFPFPAPDVVTITVT